MTSCGGVIRGLSGWPEYGLSKELVKMGHNVTVLTSSSVIKKHESKKDETIDGIRVKRFNPLIPSSFFYMLKQKFDIIHTHHLGYLAPISSYGALIKKIKSKKMVHTVHGLYHDPYIVKDVNDPFSNQINYNPQKTFPYTKPQKLANWFVHTPLYHADMVGALTKWEREELVKFGIKKDKITVIPNGVDVEKYSKGNTDFLKERYGIKGKVLLFVGQTIKRKGPEYFLKAIKILMKELPDIKGVFIGYSRNQSVERLCKNLGIGKNVNFLGFLPEKDKINAYYSSDIFVFPTLYEGFGTIFLEAMACGLPIVTTDVAGNKQIVKNRENGILVKPKSPEEIAKAVLEMLNNRPLLNKMKQNNKEKAKQYTWSNAAKKYLDVYEELIK